jgi:hypothetical protein
MTNATGRITQELLLKSRPVITESFVLPVGMSILPVGFATRLQNVQTYRYLKSGSTVSFDLPVETAILPVA